MDVNVDMDVDMDVNMDVDMDVVCFTVNEDPRKRGGIKLISTVRDRQAHVTV
jgi:hypothetical protein